MQIKTYDENLGQVEKNFLVVDLAVSREDEKSLASDSGTCHLREFAIPKV